MYRLVSRAFLAKVQTIWNQQGWSDQKAELIEEIVGCRFKKPSDTRFDFCPPANAFLRDIQYFSAKI